MKSTGILKALIIGLVLVGPVSFSNNVLAGLTPVLQPGSPTAGPVAGQFRFTYDVLLADDQKINTGAVPTASVIVQDPTGQATVLGSTFASFFTIYDFGGFVAGSNTQPAGWSFLNLATGATPNNTIPVDQAAVSNLTWYWTDGIGAATPPTPGTTITSFSALSTVGNLVINHNFTSGATQNLPPANPANNLAIGTIGSVPAPGPNTPPPPPGIPEPATLLLLGSGLAGLAGWRKWSAKKN